MLTLENLTTFLGWSTLVNFGILALSSFFLVLFRGKYTKIHGKMFGLNDSEVSQAYFRYLANYKILILAFNLSPYIALKIMG